jgi:hypothetical protein
VCRVFPQGLSLFVTLHRYAAPPRSSVLQVVNIPIPPSPQSLSMAFLSSPKDRIKRSRSTERTMPHTKGLTSSLPSAASVLHIRTRSTFRPKTVHDPAPTEFHVQGLDPEPFTPKLNATASIPKKTLRRIPVPSLSVQGLDKLSHDRPRTSPSIPSPRSTPVSRQSSIADIGDASNATTPKTKPDQLKSHTYIQIPTPPHSSSPSNWETSSAGSRNLNEAYDLRKTPSPVIDLSIRTASSKQVTPPMSSPMSASQKPQRAVLRRKSHAKPPSGPLLSIPSLTSRKSKPDLGIAETAVTPKRPTTSPAHRPSDLVSTPPPLDAAHRLKRSTSDERGLCSPRNLFAPLSPRTLTPAGAVAAAYKEQEKRRKDSSGPVRSNTDGHSRGDSHDEDGGVYYTVFGSSGKVVAVGAPESENWSHYDLDNYTPNKSKSLSRKPSLGALGRLSRKTSTKAKKGGTGSVESDCGHERAPRDEGARRASFQGRRSSSVPDKRRGRKPLGIVIDNSDAGLMSDVPQSAAMPPKSAGWSLDDPLPSAGGKIWKLMKRISTGGLREKYTAQEEAPPVPALPEGLLPTPPPKPKPSKTRSAPQSPDKSDPPISRYVRGRASFGDAPFSSRHRDIQGAPSPPTSHRPRSGKNPSHRRPITNTRCSSPVSSDKASSKYWQKSRSSSISTFEEMPPLPKRVVASGPILSQNELYILEKEQAMADFPSPPSTVDSHSPAASPSLHHGNAIVVIRKPSIRGIGLRPNGEDSETDCMSTSEFAALPTPPRHHYKSSPHVVDNQSNDGSPVVGSVSTSPTIPMFSTQGVVNQFRPVKGGDGSASESVNSTSTSQFAGTISNEFGVATGTQPPPRPQRSSRRKPLLMNQHVTARASHDHDRGGRTVLPPMSSSYPKERTLGASLDLEEDDRGGRSYGTFGSYQSMGLVELVKTSEDSTSSRERLNSSSSTHSRSPLRFREMGSREAGKDKKVRTEKEKADMWDDLLEKSDRAGGTIHLGNTTLPSDNLRFSDYSTLLSPAI